MKKRTAFTLVELLIVLGIITLLVAILLPVLSKAREASNRIYCASNLRQLYANYIMYENENRNMMIPACPTFQGAVGDFNNNTYFQNFLASYYDVPSSASVSVMTNLKTNCPKALRCPSNPRDPFYRLDFSYFGGGADPTAAGSDGLFHRFPIRWDTYVTMGQWVRGSGGTGVSGTPLPSAPALFADRCILENATYDINTGGVPETNHWDARNQQPAGGNVCSVDGSVRWFPYSTDRTVAEGFVSVYSGTFPWSSPGVEPLYIPSNGIFLYTDGHGNLGKGDGVSTYMGAYLGSGWTAPIH